MLIQIIVILQLIMRLSLKEPWKISFLIFFFYFLSDIITQANIIKIWFSTIYKKYCDIKKRVNIPLLISMECVYNFDFYRTLFAFVWLNDFVSKAVNSGEFRETNKSGYHGSISFTLSKRNISGNGTITSCMMYTTKQ